jgi:hypothetical protein
MQVSGTDLLTMSMPPDMEQPLIKKYKLKKEGPFVKTPLFLGQFCESNVQLQWTADRVTFIKGWTKFVRKSEITINNTIVFTPMDDGFDFRLHREGTSMEVIWGCKKHSSRPWEDPRYKAPKRNKRQRYPSLKSV